MTVLRTGALAGALMMSGTLAPSGAVRAQDGPSLVRAFQMTGGSRIGVSLREAGTGDSKGAEGGVLVDEVSKDGPAEKAGLKVGDAIVEFDGEHVRSVRQFARLVQETPEGRHVAAVVMRGGQRVTLTVVPARRTLDDDFGIRLLEAPRAPRAPRAPAPPVPPAAPRPPAMLSPAMPFENVFRFANGRRLGVSIESVDDQLAEFFGVKEGALVRSVTEGSSGQKAGLKAGDVITSVNGSKVYDTSDVNRAIDRVGESGDFTIEVVRDRKTQSLKGKLEPRDSGTRWRGFF